MNYEKPSDRQRLRYTELRDRIEKLEDDLAESDLVIIRVESALATLTGMHQELRTALSEKGVLIHEGKLRRVL